MSADFKPVTIDGHVLRIEQHPDRVWKRPDMDWKAVVAGEFDHEHELILGLGATQHDAVMATKDFLKKLNKALPDGRATRYSKKEQA